MKAAAIFGTVFFLLAGLAWGTDETAAVEVVDPVAQEGSCGSVEPLSEDNLQEWALGQGFEMVVEKVSAASAAAATACPAVISCNATHCVETNFCTRVDTGNNGCCVGAACLICPAGQTIKVVRCRCAGGGCMNRFSQTFSCA